MIIVIIYMVLAHVVMTIVMIIHISMVCALVDKNMARDTHIRTSHTWTSDINLNIIKRFG